ESPPPRLPVPSLGAAPPCPPQKIAQFPAPLKCLHSPKAVRLSGGSMTTPYPFTAVVGMDDLRLALLLNAVSPAVGGVLVRGEKGTAKSTAVRALADLLPAVPVVAGCRFSCDPAAPDGQCPDGPHEAGPAASRPARMV